MSAVLFSISRPLKDQVSKIFQASIAPSLIDAGSGKQLKTELVSRLAFALALTVVGIITRTIALQIHKLPARAAPPTKDRAAKLAGH